MTFPKSSNFEHNSGFKMKIIEPNKCQKLLQVESEFLYLNLPRRLSSWLKRKFTCSVKESKAAFLINSWPKRLVSDLGTTREFTSPSWIVVKSLNNFWARRLLSLRELWFDIGFLKDDCEANISRPETTVYLRCWLSLILISEWHFSSNTPSQCVNAADSRTFLSTSSSSWVWITLSIVFETKDVMWDWVVLNHSEVKCSHSFVDFAKTKENMLLLITNNQNTPLTECGINSFIIKPDLHH